MGVLVKAFDNSVKEYILQTPELEVSVLDYGATLRAIRFGGQDICLGFDDMAGYRACTSYQGATIGRYANRIAAGKFTLNGIVYDVGCNEEGRGHLHGGSAGLHQKVWRAEIETETPPRVRFTTELADGDAGYPGAMEIAVTFSLSGAALRMEYAARSDRDTIFNPTNHTYFNLNGAGGETVLSTVLQIHADAITPVDERLIPTGELLPVAGTAFDFNAPKPIGRDINDTHPQMLLGGGYDHNFVLGLSRGMRHAAHAVSSITGIALDCYTDMPGIQLYTANFLAQPGGKGGRPLVKHGGFCLETQFFPDAPNHPQFPSATLRAGETFASVTEYRFSKEE